MLKGKGASLGKGSKKSALLKHVILPNSLYDVSGIGIMFYCKSQ
ncbi:hypothetical protein HMPREF9018_1854 [Prevotella amnii CRIS 21A-A]|uniref:Uncharacterized protein n=1 Tax=Prevotella amnii CRIS 21A-A TaxID=679191 RepID=E1GY42_9BACT|nr:hypothetical protein HMPREF9018_1854 [Prevotella amnii CRIS 21A-A]